MLAVQDVTEEVGDTLNPFVEQLREFYREGLANLPRVLTAVVIGAAAVIAAILLARALNRALARTRADTVAVRLLVRITRLLAVLAASLLALSIAGVPVGSVLAALAVAGVAVGLAVQVILENFIAGVILLVRKPFRAGDQIRTSEFEGTVEDMDLRVTRLIDYDGELILIPNRDVYTNPLVNLTRRGRRRTCLMVGVDYRDDHDAAREVLRAAVVSVDSVLDMPEPEVLLTEFGESSVNFELRYWTLPDIQSVRRTQDRVLAAAKRALEDAGMTIPWPIRTLVVDRPVRVERD